MDEQEAWVFVSHASADLPAVRKVRNYLEDLGAAPLMFHLRSLTRPGQFWPIIKREIAHRNFFLYCESKAAEKSEWVRRERSVVERIGSKRNIRVGHVNVESAELDTRGLAAFMRQVRVFPTFRGSDVPRVEPYLAALRGAGFKVFDWRELRAATHHHSQSAQAILEAAEQGWIVPFISTAGLTRIEPDMPSAMEQEIGMALRARARIVPVMLDRVTLPQELRNLQALDGYTRPRDAPDILVKALLGR